MAVSVPTPLTQSLVNLQSVRVLCHFPLSHIVLQLEESPKWQLLSMVLAEIRREVKMAATTERGEGGEGTGAGKVLVVVNDERTCYQLKQVCCR